MAVLPAVEEPAWEHSGIVGEELALGSKLEKKLNQFFLIFHTLSSPIYQNVDLTQIWNELKIVVLENVRDMIAGITF